MYRLPARLVPPRRRVRPVLWIPMHAYTTQTHVRVLGYGAFLPIDHQRLIWNAVRRFRDINDRWDEAQLFVQNRAGHPAEEAGQVAVVVPLRGRAATEDVVQVCL